MLRKWPILLLCCSPALCDLVTYTDVATFIANTGVNTVATFDDVPAGTGFSFSSGGVAFTGTGSGVLDTLVGLPHSFWFGGAASSPNWVHAIDPPWAYIPLTASVSSDATAFGFLFTCFACDSTPDATLMQWTLLSGGVAVGSGSTVYDFSNSGSPPYFLGVRSSAPFDSVQVARLHIGGEPSGDAWLLDDFRFASEVPEPATGYLLGAALLLLALGRKRRGAA